MNSTYEVTSFIFKDYLDDKDIVFHLVVENQEMPIFTVAKGDNKISFSVQLSKIKEVMNHFLLNIPKE